MVPRPPTSNGQCSDAPLESWLRRSDDSRLPQRIASESTLPGVGHVGGAVGTSQSSLGGSEITTHGSIPDIFDHGMSGRVESIATRMGTTELSRTQRLLIPDMNQGSVLRADSYVSTATLLECPLKTIFGCQVAFDFDQDRQWIEHSFAHFKTLDGTQVQPPMTNKCCFCALPILGDTGKESWEARLNHIRDVHHRIGQRMAAAQLDFELVRYLFGAKAIDNNTYRDWVGKQNHTSPPSSPDSESLPPVSQVHERRHRVRRPALPQGDGR